MSARRCSWCRCMAAALALAPLDDIVSGEAQRNGLRAPFAQRVHHRVLPVMCPNVGLYTGLERHVSREPTFHDPFPPTPSAAHIAPDSRRIQIHTHSPSPSVSPTRNYWAPQIAPAAAPPGGGEDSLCPGGGGRIRSGIAGGEAPGRGSGGDAPDRRDDHICVGPVRTC